MESREPFPARGRGSYSEQAMVAVLDGGAAILINAGA